MPNENGDNSTRALLKQGLVLTVAMIVVRVIGVFYRIPLTNLWGDGALGTYGDAYTVYSLFLMISSVSVPTMMSKLIGDRVALGQYNEAKRLTRCCVILFSALGLLGCLIMLFGSEFIAVYIFNNPDLALAIRGLAPTVLIVSFMSVFRGYFQGLSNMQPSAVSQVIESLAHALFSILLAELLFPVGLNWSVFGGVIATGIAAVCSLIFLLWCYRRDAKSSKLGRAKASASTESDRFLYRAILAMILPIVLSNVIFNLKSIIDSAVFGNLMKVKGFDVETIRQMKGLYTGKFNVFLAVPIAIGDSVAAAVVPAIAGDFSLGLKKEIRRKTDSVTRTVLLITVPASIGLAVLGKPIIKLFFPGAPLGGELFWFGSFAAAFYSVSDISTGILQGVGKQKVPMWISLAATVLTVILNVLMILVFNLGIYTLPISILLFSFLRMIMNVAALRRLCGLRMRLPRMFGKPLAGSLFMGVCCAILYILAFSVFGSNALALFAALILSVVIYFFVMINLGWLSSRDMENIPYGKFLAYFKI